MNRLFTASILVIAMAGCKEKTAWESLSDTDKMIVKLDVAGAGAGCAVASLSGKPGDVGDHSTLRRLMQPFPETHGAVRRYVEAERMCVDYPSAGRMSSLNSARDDLLTAIGAPLEP